MVNKIESEGAADRLLNRDQTQEPTAHAPEFPESPGDRERGKFRRSFWRRLTQVAVSNDDGGRVTEKTDALLEAVRAELVVANAKVALNPQPVLVEGPLSIGKPISIPYMVIPGLHITTAYGSGDALGTKFSIDVPVWGGFREVRLKDLAKQSLQVDFLVFDRDFTGGTDDSAFDMADGDDPIGVLSVTTFFDQNDNSYGHKAADLEYYVPDGRLYLQAVIRGTPTLASLKDYQVSFLILDNNG